MMVVLKNPVHPGEILKEEFLDELGLTAGKLAKALHVPRTRIERIVACKMGVSADTAFRLARYFDTTPEFWLNLQRGYDLAVTAQNTDLVDELETILPLAS
jgi:addiction module HigA family antidote